MIWRAGLYGRVSTEHQEQQESIRVQRDALLQYACEKGFEVAGMYFDEGYSGTDFDRPGIVRLKKDIEDSSINIIIVKDLSRLGRNNTMTLVFLDYLSQKGVRLIAVGDSYDTLEDEDDLIGIRTWVNERYSRELSQKIRFAIYHKKRSGEYIGAFAPYGYKKSESHKNMLEVDFFAANIVRSIFELYIGGLGFMKIAARMQDMGVLNPSRYGSYGKKSDRWDWTTIKKIITNPVYTGMLVQHRYCRKSFKDRHLCAVPKEEWIKSENTHESIIDKDTFETAQKILAKRKGNFKYRCGKKVVHLFTSFLFCCECGSPFYYRGTKSQCGVYMCSRYVKYGGKGCTSHTIGEDELKEILSDNLRDIVGKNIDMNRMADEIKGEYLKENRVVEELILLDKQLTKNRDKIEMLYRDRLNDLIDKDTYIKIYGEVSSIISMLEEERDGLKNKECSKDEKEQDYHKIIERVVDLKQGIDRMTMEVLVNHITIDNNGDITIYYNFSL